MWKNIAKQAVQGEYGNPDAFCNNIEATNWMSATVATSDEKVIKHIIDVCKRDPREGKVTTGGIVTVKTVWTTGICHGQLTVSHSLNPRTLIWCLYGFMH